MASLDVAGGDTAVTQREHATVTRGKCCQAALCTPPLSSLVLLKPCLSVLVLPEHVAVHYAFCLLTPHHCCTRPALLLGCVGLWRRAQASL